MAILRALNAESQVPCLPAEQQVLAARSGLVVQTVRADLDRYVPVSAVKTHARRAVILHDIALLIARHEQRSPADLVDLAELILRNLEANGVQLDAEGGSRG